jgi:hypothetical protein
MSKDKNSRITNPYNKIQWRTEPIKRLPHKKERRLITSLLSNQNTNLMKTELYLIFKIEYI